MTTNTNAALRSAAKSALKAMEALNGVDTETESVTIHVSDEIAALRAALTAAAQPPEGWVMVPMEPTDAMVQASLHLDLSYMPGQDGVDRAAVYRAMLAAAPKAAPQPAVQQGAPVAWRSWDSENSRWNFTLWPDEWAGHADVWEPLYTYPAAPVAQGDAEDAARYRFLAEHCRSTSEHWGGRWSIIIDGPAPGSHDSDDDFDAAVDAARKQGGA